MPDHPGLAAAGPEPLRAADRPSDGPAEADAPIILSFDVEPHHRIEAAAGLEIDPALAAHYDGRVGPATRWLLDRLDDRAIKATFFIVGKLARTDPGLVREIHDRGHEVASHSAEHRRLHTLTPAEFREDTRQSLDALAELTGTPVVGYRAPTFSVVRQTAWAVDVLAELGLAYDSSIYPVRHDRYGVPGAPRSPFLARGVGGGSILEIPPLTLRVMGLNLPVGGGGYFRLLPLAVMERALVQARRTCRPPVTMLYFHPWEFDPGQPPLPLDLLKRFRTYVGIRSSGGRLTRLLGRHRFARAADVAAQLGPRRDRLPSFDLSA